MTGSLSPLVFDPMRPGEIKPTGWLLRQLQIQADGLSGHLDEFWPDIKDSRWFGGNAEGWERAPYWLDGFIPLAFLLEDEKLIGKARHYIAEILARRQPDGWLGPVEIHPLSGQPEVPAGYDLWAELLIFKVLVEYHRATQDEAILDVLEQALTFFDRLIDTHPLANWGQFRWFEGLIAIYYLYDRRPQGWLLDLAVKIQAQGFHWGELFERWPFQEPTPKGRWSYMSHVVNNAMAVKSHGLWWRMSRDPQDQATVRGMIDQLQRFHGMVTGVFSGDECLAGISPTQGTELCAVVEYAYSLECLLSLMGEIRFADRLEQIVFNALPATFSPDMWAHQYDQQVNQVECSIRPDRPWTTNGPESNLFGLEPNYGCCTANLSQGWPKYASHLWMRIPEGGLAALSYAPCRIQTEVAGGSVQVQVESDYPFGPDIVIRVHAENCEAFALMLRIPEWAEDASLSVDGVSQEVTPGTFARLYRSWNGESMICLSLPMVPRLVPAPRGAAGLAYGPLVFGLPIAEEWRRVNVDRPLSEPPHADYEVHPESPWNYGLLLDPEMVKDQVTIVRLPVGNRPFSPEGAPLEARVKGRLLSQWGMECGSAAELPRSPVESDQPLSDLRLIPYGCTNLRIAVFPLLRE